MLATVFISYAREDQPTAMRLYDDLRASRCVEPWLDQRCLIPGQDWALEVLTAIRRSDYFLALLSPASVSKQGYVQKEMREAISVLDQLPPGKIYLIPCRLEDCSPHFDCLSSLHWVDFFPEYSAGLTYLLRALCPEDDSGQASPALPPSPGDRILLNLDARGEISLKRVRRSLSRLPKGEYILVVCSRRPRRVVERQILAQLVGAQHWSRNKLSIMPLAEFQEKFGTSIGGKLLPFVTTRYFTWDPAFPEQWW